ncbi:hypothetical protein [Streptomyces sp. NPDC049879]|uniref:hypothetical protein n=1 Tax=Streptomyces sp. NPDC049879 TaxID=3365598 RepID=UPI0037B4286D
MTGTGAAALPVPAARTARSAAPRLRLLPGDGTGVSGPGNPLALGRDARARLDAAADELFAAADAAGVPVDAHAARLGLVVLTSRAAYGSCVATVRRGELGRWMGVSEDTVASDVLRPLRAAGLITTRQVIGERGEVTGLQVRVEPLLAARQRPGHPLRLTRAELAVLLRLLEALWAPGWRHRDGSVTRAGLLGGPKGRSGRAAPTDRLALLLLALRARPDGWVRLCGGRADAKRGRAATTVAQLLGCSPAAGAAVLARLRAAGVVESVRRPSPGLLQRSRLRVPAVAAAHGFPVAAPGAPVPDVPAPRAAVEGEESVSGPAARGRGPAGEEGGEHRDVQEHPYDGEDGAFDLWPDELTDEQLPPEEEMFSAAPDVEGVPADAIVVVREPAAAAPDSVFLESGDPHAAPRHSDAPAVPADPLVTDAPPREEPMITDPHAAPPLHTTHAQVAEVSSSSDGNSRCSGARAAEGDRRRPERARTGEETAAPATAVDPGTAHDSRGPLRGEQPVQPAINTPATNATTPASRRRAKASPATTRTPVVAVPHAPELLLPRDVRTALTPVADLLAVLRDGARRVVVTAARAELSRLRAVLATEHVTGANEDAAELLAARLVDRRAEQTGPMTTTVGWMLRRGLPSRGCGPRCADGIRLDTGADCPVCARRVADRRADRARAVLDVRAEMPGATPAVRRAEVERRLHAAVRRQAVLDIGHAERAARSRERYEAHVRDVAARRAAAEAERAALPCQDCDTPGAAGLCTRCGQRRKVRASLSRAAETLAIATAIEEHTDPARLTSADAARRLAAAEARVRTELAAALDDARAQGALPATLGTLAVLTADQLNEATEHRALALLARTAAAVEEGEKAAEAVLRAAHIHGGPDAARVRAELAAHQARTRTARHILHTAREHLHRLRPADPGDTPDPCPGHNNTPCGQPQLGGGLCLPCRARTTPHQATTPHPHHDENPPHPCPGHNGTPCGQPTRHTHCLRCARAHLAPPRSAMLSVD